MILTLPVSANQIGDTNQLILAPTKSMLLAQTVDSIQAQICATKDLHSRKLFPGLTAYQLLSWILLLIEHQTRGV